MKKRVIDPSARAAAKAMVYLGTHPYRTVFSRALLMAGLRTAMFKQLAAQDGHAYVLLGVLITEGMMSWATSSAVGLRARKDHLPHFDTVWATGAVCGVLAGITAIHFIYHVHLGIDPNGCLMRWAGLPQIFHAAAVHAAPR